MKKLFLNACLALAFLSAGFSVFATEKEIPLPGLITPKTGVFSRSQQLLNLNLGCCNTHRIYPHGIKGIPGPQGVAGIKGPRGPRGETGESAPELSYAYTRSSATIQVQEDDLIINPSPATVTTTSDISYFEGQYIISQSGLYLINYGFSSPDTGATIGLYLLDGPMLMSQIIVPSGGGAVGAQIVYEFTSPSNIYLSMYNPGGAFTLAPLDEGGMSFYLDIFRIQ